MLTLAVDRSPAIIDRIAQVRQRGDRIVTCAPVVGEWLAGIEYSDSRARNHLRAMRLLDKIPIRPFDWDAA